MKLTEKNKQRIAAILFVLFFVVVYKCSGQVERVRRYDLNPEITTIFPSTPMKFDSGDNDTIYLSILSDSLKTHEYKLFSFFPRQFNNYTIQIWFDDNTFDSYSADRTSEDFAEFDLTKQEAKKLKTTTFNQIVFINNNIPQHCIRIKSKDFFIKFFKQLK